MPPFTLNFQLSPNVEFAGLRTISASTPWPSRTKTDPGAASAGPMVSNCPTLGSRLPRIEPPR